MSEKALFLLTLHILDTPWFYLWFLCLLCWFSYELETSTRPIQIHLLESHWKWGLGLNSRKVYLNPLVTHYWPFQVDALLWLLAVLCYHLIALFKLQFLFSYKCTFEFRVTICLENSCLLNSLYVICLLPSISLWLFYLVVLWAGFRI